MSRQCLLRSDFLPYHVTARSNNREVFHLPLAQVWEILCDECLRISIVYEVEIHALVLMPNHFHLLLTVPRHDLGVVMNSFMSSLTRMLNLKSGRLGHVFGGPYYRSLIRGSRYYGHALKYIYRNPVRAGICPQVEDYRYSTLRGLLGFELLSVPLRRPRSVLDLSLPQPDDDGFLRWLNRSFPTEAESLIRLGLRKKVFENLIDRVTRRPVGLLEQDI